MEKFELKKAYSGKAIQDLIKTFFPPKNGEFRNVHFFNTWIDLDKGIDDLLSEKDLGKVFPDDISFLNDYLPRFSNVFNASVFQINYLAYAYPKISFTVSQSGYICTDLSIEDSI